MLLFGSFSCDIFDEQARMMETLYEAYQDRAEFLIVYIREAGHQNVSVQFLYDQVDFQNDSTLERGQRSCQVADYLHITLPMAGDREDLQAELAYQGFPMRIVVVDLGGKIVLNAGKNTRTARNLDQFGYWLKTYLTQPSSAQE